MLRFRRTPGFTPVKRTYAALEAAILAHPFGSQLAGLDATGRNVYVLSYGDASLPVCFITFGIHASEWQAVEMGMEFLRRWAEDASPEFRWLRTHFRCVSIPCVCPSGYEFGTYKNANGVNLNRNFDKNWSDPIYDVDPSNANYRGTAPFSEPETQIIRDTVYAVDPLIAVDCHTTTGDGGIDTGKIYVKYRWQLTDAFRSLRAAYPELTHMEWSTGNSPTTVGFFGAQTSRNGLPVIPSLLETNANSPEVGMSYGMTALYLMARKAHDYVRAHEVK